MAGEETGDVFDEGGDPATMLGAHHGIS